MDNLAKATLFILICLALFAALKFVFPVLHAISVFIIKFFTFASRAAFRG